MDNLAGIPIKETNKQILKEFNIANITPVRVGVLDNEVKTEWVVYGNMPLDLANDLHKKYGKRLQIRVAGMAGNDDPENWAKPKDYDEVCQAYYRQYMFKEITYDQMEEICRNYKVCGERFVQSYHIDTQEGLCEFVRFVLKHNIIG